MSDWMNRRSLLRRSLVAGAALAAPGAAWAACPITPRQGEGPFYMNGADDPRGGAANDLTRVPGAPRAAEGDVIYVGGRVTDADCRPIAGFRVEIWQACATGRYAHRRDRNPAELDPYFGYYGHEVTGEDGTYAFKTIHPGPYSIGPGLVRPSHIHFKIWRNGTPVLTTQMYFEGDRYNDGDPLLNAVGPREQQRLIIAPGNNPATGEDNYFRFDLSLSDAGRRA